MKQDALYIVDVLAEQGHEMGRPSLLSLGAEDPAAPPRFA
jgi:predicted PhzF superfamily epimerase YddE/YHI9